MVPGFNTNVERQGVVFHLQSEDSGRSHPHIMTHLYHGGTILASEKLSYAEKLESPDLATLVRRLMEEQHEALLLQLENGELDRQIAERLGPDVFPLVESADANSADATPAEPEPRASAETRQAGEQQSRGAEERERPLDEWVLDYLIERSQRDKARLP
jgi:hypothetical protein